MLKTMMKNFRTAAWLLFLPILALLPARPAQALAAENNSAVIFVYQRIIDADDDSGDLAIDQFRDQIRELQAGGYSVLPLPAIADALKSGRTLPAKTIGISFDGDDKSVARVAAPLLLKARFPFTVFIAPAQLDRNAPESMNWNDIRYLQANALVTIGLHSVDYASFAGASLTDIQRQINDAKASYRARLKAEPVLFAYPFGAYSLQYRNSVEAAGFTAAFGQQPGAAWPGSDLLALPRFDIAALGGDIDRFRMAAMALPLPVSGIEPRDPLLENDRPAIGFTADDSLRTQLPSLSCTITDQPPPTVQIVGDARVELRLKNPLPSGQATLTCILPAQPKSDDATARWRWFGMTLIAP
jgi:peptidoglycan/xylan/chitin deacetylase (PgdA/CDA1 family)